MHGDIAASCGCCQNRCQTDAPSPRARPACFYLICVWLPTFVDTINAPQGYEHLHKLEGGAIPAWCANATRPPLVCACDDATQRGCTVGRCAPEVCAFDGTWGDGRRGRRSHSALPFTLSFGIFYRVEEGMRRDGSFALA